MTKKISKIKEYAARYLYEVIGMEIDSISEEVNVSTETLTDLLDQSKRGEANIKTVTSPSNKNKFIRETCVKGTKNVTIMTEGASQLGGNSEKTSVNSKFESSVYRPRG